MTKSLCNGLCFLCELRETAFFFFWRLRKAGRKFEERLKRVAELLIR